ncbi:MAG: transposase [Planctomycetia bacterium]|nr:transposase [Planctomycetia bacterium]
MNDPIAYFISWTTYGTWFPGDVRGWRKTGAGNQTPQPLLAEWCRRRLSEDPVYLSEAQRAAVKRACHEHIHIRGWHLHTVNPRTNHIHLAVTADSKPEKVRDQLKANCTRVLREEDKTLIDKRMWTRGGDIEFTYTDEELEQVIQYINEVQDRKQFDL